MVRGDDATLGTSTPGPADAIAQARRLREAGRLVAAIEVLQPWADGHPDDVEAARLLAETLYWTKDTAAARARYEAALRLHPDDVGLGLGLGRLLVEAGEGGAARALLTSLGSDPSAAGEVETLLGTLAFWEGDLLAAEGHLRAALGTDTDKAEALRRLREVAALRAPWLRIAASHGSDDQPLRRAGFAVEVGGALRNRRAFSLRLSPEWLEPDGATTRLQQFEGTLTQTVGRLEAAATAGLLQEAGGAFGTGGLALRLSLPRGFVLRARADRSLHVSSPSSVAYPILTDSLGGKVEWSRSGGWLGQASWQWQRFPDDNTMSGASAWVLAPVAGGEPARLSLGYAFWYQNAWESRYVPAPGVRGEEGGLAGSYEPYYTPAGARAHLALASITLQPWPLIRLVASGSLGLHAREDAPYVYFGSSGPGEAIGGGARRGFYERTFRPWEVKARLEVARGDLTLALAGRYIHGPYYTATTLGLEIGYRFIARDLGGAVR